MSLANILVILILYRSAVHRDGDYHRAVHGWIFAESTQQLLLQKRADCKDSWPGLWDISSACHVSAGDTSPITAKYIIRPNDKPESLCISVVPTSFSFIQF